MAKFEGARDYESLVRFVTRNANGETVREEPARSSSTKAKRKRVGSTAWLIAKGKSLLTEHDPLQAGVVMLGIAMVTGACMLLALCIFSSPSQH